MEELIERIAAAYDVLEICDILDITPEDLLEAFEDRLQYHLDKFEDVLVYYQDYGEDDG